MRHALAAALLALPALLAQLSGCSGVGGGGTGAQSPSLPPAEVPDVTPAPSPARDATRWLAPGLTDRGVERSWLLVGAHEGVLANISYTSRTVETTRYANGTVWGRIRTTVRAAPGTFHTVSVPNGTHARAYPFPDADGTRYFSLDRADAGVPSLYALLSSVETRTAGNVGLRALIDYSASAGVSKSWKCSPFSFVRMFSAAAAPSPAEMTACHSSARTIAPVA